MFGRQESNESQSLRKQEKPKKKKVAGAPKKVHPKAKMAAALKPKTPTTKRPPKSQ